MFSTLLAGALATGAWLAWHILGDIVGEALGLFRPVTRPLWRAMVEARSPWPLFAMLAIGFGTAVAGLRLMGHTDWSATVGALLFFGGAGSR
jgi:hypothetical protein